MQKFVHIEICNLLAAIEKNGGCNHMSCKSCTWEFCWVCLGSWSGSHYNVRTYRIHNNLCSVLLPQLKVEETLLLDMKLHLLIYHLINCIYFMNQADFMMTSESKKLLKTSSKIMSEPFLQQPFKTAKLSYKL